MATSKLRYRVKGSDEVLKVKVKASDTFGPLRCQISQAQKINELLQWQQDGSQIDDDTSVEKFLEKLDDLVFDLVPADPATSYRKTGCLRLRGARANSEMIWHIDCYLGETIGSVRKLIESQYFADSDHHVLIAKPRAAAFADDVLIGNLDLSLRYTMSLSL